MPRDPRVDPRPGDVVSVCSGRRHSPITVKILARKDQQLLYLDADEIWPLTLTRWIRWVGKAEVLHAAD